MPLVLVLLTQDLHKREKRSLSLVSEHVATGERSRRKRKKTGKKRASEVYGAEKVAAPTRPCRSHKEEGLIKEKKLEKRSLKRARPLKVNPHTLRQQDREVEERRRFAEAAKQS